MNAEIANTDPVGRFLRTARGGSEYYLIGMGPGEQAPTLSDTADPLV